MASSLIGRLPQGTCSLAILLLVRSCTHSFADSGLAVGALAIAQAGAAPVIGRRLDRLGPARVILTTSVLQAISLAGLGLLSAGHPPLIVLVMLSAAAGATMPPVTAAVRSLWPRLLSDTQLDAAFSVDAAGQEIAWTLGPVLVGAVAGTASSRAAIFTVAAVTLATSGWFVACVAGVSLRLAPSTPRQAGHSAFSSVTRILLPITFLMGAGLGGIEVGIPALATRISSPAMSGVLLACWAVGSMAGGVAFGLRDWAVRRERLLGIMLTASGAVVLPIAVSSTLATAIIGAFVAGVFTAPIFACISSLISHHAPENARATAFTWNNAAIVSGVASGSALCGEVVTLTSPTVALITAGAIGASGGVLALIALRTSPSRSAVHA